MCRKRPALDASCRSHIPMIRAGKDFDANADPIADASEHVVFRSSDRSQR